MTLRRALYAALLTLAVALVTVVIGGALYLLPICQVQGLEGLTTAQRFAAENDARRTIARVIGGIFVVFGLFLTYRRITATERSADAALRNAETAHRNLEENTKNAQESLQISREGQITQRWVLG